MIIWWKWNWIAHFCLSRKPFLSKPLSPSNTQSSNVQTRSVFPVLRFILESTAKCVKSSRFLAEMHDAIQKRISRESYQPIIRSLCTLCVSISVLWSHLLTRKRRRYIESLPFPFFYAGIPQRINIFAAIALRERVENRRNMREIELNPFPSDSPFFCHHS